MPQKQESGPLVPGPLSYCRGLNKKSLFVNPNIGKTLFF